MTTCLPTIALTHFNQETSVCLCKLSNVVFQHLRLHTRGLCIQASLYNWNIKYKSTLNLIQYIQPSLTFAILPVICLMLCFVCAVGPADKPANLFSLNPSLPAICPAGFNFCTLLGLVQASSSPPSFWLSLKHYFPV